MSSTQSRRPRSRTPRAPRARRPPKVTRVHVAPLASTHTLDRRYQRATEEYSVLPDGTRVTYTRWVNCYRILEIQHGGTVPFLAAPHPPTARLPDGPLPTGPRWHAHCALRRAAAASAPPARLPPALPGAAPAL